MRSKYNTGYLDTNILSGTVTPTPSKDLPVITVSAVVLCNTVGEVLHVRKRDTLKFMLPGGKPEPGESPRDCALREVAEELGVSLRDENLVEFGVFDTAAANESGHSLRAHVYRCVAELDAAVFNAQSEIVELRWVDPTHCDSSLAPLSTERVFPRLRDGLSV